MSKRLEEFVEIIRKWPHGRQEDAAEVLAALVEQGAGVYELSDEERGAIDRSRAQARRGEYATDDEVAAVLRKHGL